MSELPRRLIQLWQALPATRRIMLVGVVLGIAVVGFVAFTWSSAVTYGTLFSDLEAKDSSQIVDQLQAQGVPYQLVAGGATIRVPQDKVDALRLSFAGKGLPAGGNVGFEAMGGNSFTATDFQQRLNYQRGLEGELGRTIESFDVVSHARVHIVLPEKSLFVKEQQPPTAAVVLELRPGKRLSPSEVKSIAHLVGGAVEGLKQDNVTIVDTNGAMLFDGTQQDDNGVGASGNQLEMQRGYEQALEGDVQGLLDRTLGAGKSSVKVNATLNFDRLEQQKETYTPGSPDGVKRSASSVTENYTANGQNAGTGTVPGAAANVPGASQALAAAATAAGNGTDYKRTEDTANFELNHEVTKTVQAVGGVKALSVSLLLDESVPEAQVPALRDAVNAAVGINAQRGDTVAVSRFAFDHSTIDEAKAAFAAEDAGNDWMQYARIGVPILALVLAFFFFRRLMRSAGRQGAYRVYDAGMAALPEPSGVIAEIGGVPRSRTLPLPPPEEMRSEVEERVGELVLSQPTVVSEVMQAWLKEE